MAIKGGRVSLLLDMSGFEIAREGRVSLVLGNRQVWRRFVPMQCVWQFFSIWSGQKLTPGKFAVLPKCPYWAIISKAAASVCVTHLSPCLSLKSCQPLRFYNVLWSVSFDISIFIDCQVCQ